MVWCADHEVGRRARRCRYWLYSTPANSPKCEPSTATLLCFRARLDRLGWTAPLGTRLDESARFTATPRVDPSARPPAHSHCLHQISGLTTRHARTARLGFEMLAGDDEYQVIESAEPGLVERSDR